MRILRKLASYSWKIRAKFYAHSVAAKIYPQLMRSAQKKFGNSAPPSKDGRAYLIPRAAQLAQPFVDDLMLANPRFPALIGNQLVVTAAQKCAALVMRQAWRRQLA